VFTRPVDVDDADLVMVLAREWAIDVAALRYLAIGFGSHHWQATTASGNWFVTVDDLVAKRRDDETVRTTGDHLLAALATARSLHDAGFEFVVAPTRTRSGQVAYYLGDRYLVAVYPFVRGQAFDYGSYSDASHRDAVLQLIATLHRSPAQCHEWATTETFAIARRGELSSSAGRSSTTPGPRDRLPIRHAACCSNTPERLRERSTPTTRWLPP